MATFEVEVPFYDLSLFGLEIKISGTAAIEYSNSYSGFVTRSVDIDRQFVPTMHPRPAVTWPDDVKLAIKAEAVRQFDLQCREDAEVLIGQDMEERGIRRAA